jgi:anti-sigma regulatory factor (Ser/Thr protein kinase)/Pyruvate/2-oxoacid:ferredoxin oxidoreductase delta subunit
VSERIEIPIQGGDYDGGGRASRELKERLKRLGVEPAALRRAMVAAYEAEMNVVIHAARGWLRAELSPGRLEVEVDDQGPGIPDLERALRPGFSTAPARARELGFGAGMGLPNIKKNADAFELTSEPGRGTRLRFRVDFRTAALDGRAAAALGLRPERCTACRKCLPACPTAALRLHAGAPSLLAHLCIECTACLAACAAGVFVAAEELSGEAQGELDLSGVACLVLPAAFTAAFGPRHSPDAVRAVLEGLGAGRLVWLDDFERALGAALAAWPREARRPVVSPACPAVVELVRLRFPALLPQVAPFLSPVEAALRSLAGGPVALVAACPAQRTAARRVSSPGGLRFVPPEALRRKVWQALEAGSAPGALSGRRGEPDAPVEGWLRVTGLTHVRAVLEAVEDGRVGELAGLEAWACEQGCAGAPWLGCQPHLARFRLRGLVLEGAPEARAVPRERPLQARPGVRLDPHLPTAMQRLGDIDRLNKRLRGIDCGLCGAPGCAAFAEDVVLGRALRAACPYPDREEAGT